MKEKIKSLLLSINDEHILFSQLCEKAEQHNKKIESIIKKIEEKILGKNNMVN